MKTSNKIKLILFLTTLSAIIVFLSLFVLRISNENLDYLSKHKLISKEVTNQNQIVVNKESNPKEEILPNNHQIAVPFISQAPYGIWDDLHQNACEEASFLMLYNWLIGKIEISIEDADSQIKEMVEHENALGYNTSITLQELVNISKDNYSLDNLMLKSVSSVKDIKETLFLNNSPIIAGMSGKKLNNPNFRNGGPNYHMLVITGYNTDSFITNDPGTRKGENYTYNQELLLEALHNYDPTDINLGKKDIIYLQEDS